MAEEMAQMLSTLDALREDRSLDPVTHVVASSCL